MRNITTPRSLAATSGLVGVALSALGGALVSGLVIGTIESLQGDIQEELGHAQQFASRIKELYGVVPGSLEFSAEQSYLQPPEHQPLEQRGIVLEGYSALRGGT